MTDMIYAFTQHVENVWVRRKLSASVRFRP